MSVWLAAGCVGGRAEIFADDAALLETCPAKGDPAALAARTRLEPTRFAFDREYPWNASLEAWTGPGGEVDRLRSEDVACFTHPSHEAQNLAALNRVLRVAGPPPPSVPALVVARAVASSVVGEPYVIGDGEDCLDPRTFTLRPMVPAVSLRFQKFCAGRAIWELGRRRLAFELIGPQGALQRWVVELKNGQIARVLTLTVEPEGTFGFGN